MLQLCNWFHTKPIPGLQTYIFHSVIFIFYFFTVIFWMILRAVVLNSSHGDLLLCTFCRSLLSDTLSSIHGWWSESGVLKETCKMWGPQDWNWEPVLFRVTRFSTVHWDFWDDDKTKYFEIGWFIFWVVRMSKMHVSNRKTVSGNGQQPLLDNIS